jgi:hypothetical protein
MASVSSYDNLHLPWHGFVEAKEVVWSYSISYFAHDFSDTLQKLVVHQRAGFSYEKLQNRLICSFFYVDSENGHIFLDL